MSITKIPFILAYTLGWRKSFTAPNPPASKEELIPSYKLDNEPYIRSFTNITKIFAYLVSMTEIATILAREYPSSPLSRKVLEVLIWNHKPRADGLRLSPTTATASFLVVLGACLRWLTFRYLGTFFRFDISIQKDHRLITTGPYSIVRHPSYTACYLMTFPGWFAWNFGSGSWITDSGFLDTFIGKAILGAILFLFILPIMVLGLGRVGMEDDCLRKHFGQEWEEWASRVKYRMVPGIW